MNALLFPKNPASVEREAKHAERLSKLIASIPVSVRKHGRLFAFCERYALVTSGLSSRERARVVLPWQRRHEPKRPPQISMGKWRRIRQHSLPQVPRGRASNPTVLR
jgi:hypothetical protein